MTSNDKRPETRACALCDKPVDQSYAPFCSKRCADVDLNRWLSGGYAIPGAPEDDAADVTEASSTVH